MTDDEFLKSYNPKDYDAPLCTVDMCIFAVDEDELKVLLVKRSAPPFKDRWALPGGFPNLKIDTSVEETAFRKLFEKTGVKSPYLEQVGTVGNSSRDPRGWSVTVLYFALIDYLALPQKEIIDPQELSEWVPVVQAFEYGLAFDHEDLLKLAINRLRSKTRYAALPINLMPENFTLTELQNMFELILGLPLQKKSFRRRIETSGLLTETGEMRPTSRRPAALYRRSNTFSDDFIFPGLLDVHPEVF